MDFQSSCHQWPQSQLLSYVLNGAGRYQNVDDMAAEFSTQFKSLSHLMQMDEKALCSIKGIGPIKAKQIMAMLALHRAWNEPQDLPQSIKKAAMRCLTFTRYKHLLMKNFMSSTSIGRMFHLPGSSCSRVE